MTPGMVRPSLRVLPAARVSVAIRDVLGAEVPEGFTLVAHVSCFGGAGKETETI